MFIEKARQLEDIDAVGGIIIDHNTSANSPNGGIFSMTGDGNNDVYIPLVLMFKEEAFQLLHLLSKQPTLIVYIGDEKLFKESFYQQMELLESLVAPFNQTSERWTYGHVRWLERRNQCPVVSKKLKRFEMAVNQKDLQEQFDVANGEAATVRFEHVIQTGKSLRQTRYAE